MKNLTTRLRLASLPPLILLACTSAYGQLTPIGDSYSNTESPITNYGSKTVLDVESTQTSFMQLCLASIHSSYTSAEITKATLKLSANSGTGGVTSAVFEPKGDSGLLAPTGLSRQT
jgi:hypothetical protein